jgi:hypothetical protein
MESYLVIGDSDQIDRYKTSGSPPVFWLHYEVTQHAKAGVDHEPQNLAAWAIGTGNRRSYNELHLLTHS